MTVEPVAPAVADRIVDPTPRRANRALVALLAVDLLLFAGGVTAHSGIPIPLGFGTWVEPVIVPAAIIEGTAAAGLAAALTGWLRSAPWAGRLAWWILWYSFAGVLWGMGRLAMGSIPEAHTMSNDGIVNLSTYLRGLT